MSQQFNKDGSQTVTNGPLVSTQAHLVRWVKWKGPEVMPDAKERRQIFQEVSEGMTDATNAEVIAEISRRKVIAAEPVKAEIIKRSQQIEWEALKKVAIESC